jgi:hypothetical protein
MNQNLTYNASWKLLCFYIICLLVLYPLYNTFGSIGRAIPSAEHLNLSSYFNYFALTFSALVFLLKNRPSFSRAGALISLFIIFLLFFNYFLTALASEKWLLNWLGYLFISVVLIGTLSSLDENKLELLNRKYIKYVVTISTILSSLFFFTWLLDFTSFFNHLVNYRHNNVIALLTYSIGLEKQAAGTMMGLILITCILSWNCLTPIQRGLMVVNLLVFLPVLMGIRTLHLALALTLFFLLAWRNQSRKIGAVFIFIACLCLLVFYLEPVLVIIELYYDRFPSLMFAWSMMTESWLGLGNGGYHLYVLEYNDKIVSTFGSERMIERNYFWVAPESDLVYFMASWGVLSVFFFAGFVWLLARVARLLSSKVYLYPFERTVLIMSCFMIFSGISQDNSGKLIWWVYLAAGLGILIRHQRRSKFDPAASVVGVNEIQVKHPSH